MAQPIMDTKLTLFEGVLTEINWGQRNQQYRSVDYSLYNPTAAQVDQEGTLKEQIALYICWCASVAASDRANKTSIFSSNEILTRRSTIVSALLTRMSREQPNHPALIILANDYNNAVQKGLVYVFCPYRSVQLND